MVVGQRQEQGHGMAGTTLRPADANGLADSALPNRWDVLSFLDKQTEVRLEGKAYSDFIREVFTRDGWQCRRCGNREQLQNHHLIKRSKKRLDVLWNCLALCAKCHQLVEDSKVIVIGDDANELVKFRFPADVVQQQGS